MIEKRPLKPRVRQPEKLGVHLVGVEGLATKTNALIEEPLVRVAGGLSADRIATCKAVGVIV
jgi:hypothetical protein